MKKKYPTTLTDQIRQAMDNSGLSHYRICMDTGIDKGTMSRFYHGIRGMSLENLDILFGYLQLEVMDSKAEKRTLG